MDVGKWARKLVADAKEAGLLVPPSSCEGCGVSEADIVGGLPDVFCALEAHHEDYSKPLEVDWLCPDCHGARHKEEDCTPRANISFK
jgi:hypothetical protein